jgi:periplasmic protein TonB
MMNERLDILDRPESIRNPIFQSLALHAGIVALVILYTTARGEIERWGDPQSLGGGAVGITPVDRIPIQTRRGRVNPLANDTESQVPAPAKPQPPKPAAKEEPDAVALKSRNAPRKAPAAARPSPQNPVSERKPNQVASTTGQAATSPLFSQAPGGGGVGSGSTSPFGNRFGYYEQLIRDKVARNWRSQELDSTVRNPVVVTFDISRSGGVQNVKVRTSSGSFAMDQSAQRAILMSSPFPPLPAQYERNSATIEFWFRLQ